MSDNSTSIVPIWSNYPDREIKAKEIVEWLIGIRAVKPVKTDCTLSNRGGYPIDTGAALLTHEPEYLPFNLITCGLDVITERTIFHAGQNGLDSFVCPNCGEDILEEAWDLDHFQQTGKPMVCPLCKQPADPNDYDIEPTWGFSNLGFTFYNWPALSHQFIREFEQRLGCGVKVVECHI